jgi:hypothetical protein
MLTLAAVKEGTAATAQRSPVWLNPVLQSTVALHAPAARDQNLGPRDVHVPEPANCQRQRASVRAEISKGGRDVDRSHGCLSSGG